MPQQIFHWITGTEMAIGGQSRNNFWAELQSTQMYDCSSAEHITSVGVEMVTLQLPCTCCNRRLLLQQLMLTTAAIVSKGRGDHYSLLLRVFLQWLGITSGNLFRYKPIGPLNEKESCPQPIGYNINFGVTYFTGPTLPTTSAEWKH